MEESAEESEEEGTPIFLERTKSGHVVIAAQLDE
jgi:hypothetical protein